MGQGPKIIWKSDFHLVYHEKGVNHPSYPLIFFSELQSIVDWAQKKQFNEKTFLARALGIRRKTHWINLKKMCRGSRQQSYKPTYENWLLYKKSVSAVKLVASSY